VWCGVCVCVCVCVYARVRVRVGMCVFGRRVYEHAKIHPKVCVCVIINTPLSLIGLAQRERAEREEDRLFERGVDAAQGPPGMREHVCVCVCVCVCV
jgi:hypothetical protein